MKNEKLKVVTDVATQVLMNSNPLLGPIVGALISSARDAKVAADKGGVDELAIEARRQELSLNMAKMQAQMAQ